MRYSLRPKLRPWRGPGRSPIERASAASAIRKGLLGRIPPLREWISPGCASYKRAAVQARRGVGSTVVEPAGFYRASDLRHASGIIPAPSSQAATKNRARLVNPLRSAAHSASIRCNVLPLPLHQDALVSQDVGRRPRYSWLSAWLKGSRPVRTAARWPIDKADGRSRSDRGFRSKSEKKTRPSWHWSGG